MGNPIAFGKWSVISGAGETLLDSMGLRLKERQGDFG